METDSERQFAVVLEEPVRWGVGNEGHAGAIKVEVIQTEPDTADAFVGIEVNPYVVTATLPTQFDARIDYVP